MNRLEHVRKLWDKALQDSDLNALQQTSTIWQSTAGAERTDAELRNVRKVARSEAVRFWISVLAPLISAAALVGTLIFQIHEFSENARLQREAAEDAQYRDALKTIQDPHTMNAEIGFPEFESFFDSPRYGKQVYQIAISLLPHTTEPGSFDSLFAVVASHTDWNNFSDVIGVSAGLLRSWRGWDRNVKKLEEAKRRMADSTTAHSHPVPSPTNSRGVPAPPIPPPPGQPFGSQQPSEPYLHTEQEDLNLEQVRNIRSSVESELKKTSDFLAHFLKQHHVQAAHLDFSGAYIASEDLAGVDLGAALLKDTDFDYDDVQGTNLGSVSLFEGSSWDSTAWWRAAQVNAPLLEYLKKYFPYSPKSNYRRPETLLDYQKELSRLARSAN